MYCQHCGNQIPDDSQFCPECGNRITNTPTDPPVSHQPSPEPDEVEYIGFWERFGAHIIDSIILTILSIVVFICVAVMLLVTTLDYYTSIYLSVLACFPVSYLYYAYLESSPRQGTFGKSFLGIIVTDLDGSRISFGRATVRFIGRVIESISYGLLYLIIPFTAKKRGLHDFMAGTVVVRKRV